MRLIRPDEEAPTLRQVDFQRLWAKGIRVLLVDLDNTLCLWRGGEFPPFVARLLRRLRGQGFKIAVLTNARLPKDSPVRGALAALGIPLWDRAKKPWPGAYRRALRQLEAKPQQAAVIGDQLLTDILGGKLSGLYTVLVSPLSPREARRTRVNRTVELLLGRRVPKR